MQNLIKFHKFIGYYHNSIKIEEISYEILAKRFNTPLIIFSKNTLIKNIRDLKNAFKKHYPKTKIHYAFKANYLKEVCKIIKEEEIDIEILSDVEYNYSKTFGFKDKQIIFNGCAKTDNEIKLMVDNDIKCINCDSLSEIKRIDHYAMKKKKVVDIGLRLHPDIKENSLFVERGEKLGVDISSGEAMDMIHEISKMNNIRLIGLNAHILSKEDHPKKHKAIAKELCLFNEKIKRLGFNIRFIDIGGGLNSNFLIRYNNNSLDQFAKEIASILKRYKFDGELIIEPGRYIINDAFCILTKIITKKSSIGNRWVLVDAATNILIPTRHNRFYPIACKKTKRSEIVNVGDGIGSTSGIIQRETRMYHSDEGNYILIINSGAYSMSMSENFVYLKPKIIMIDKKKIRIIEKGTTTSEFIKRVY